MRIIEADGTEHNTKEVQIGWAIVLLSAAAWTLGFMAGFAFTVGVLWSK